MSGTSTVDEIPAKIAHVLRRMDELYREMNHHQKLGTFGLEEKMRIYTELVELQREENRLIEMENVLAQIAQVTRKMSEVYREMNHLQKMGTFGLEEKMRIYTELVELQKEENKLMEEESKIRNDGIS
jgi:hypothetical protein